MRRTKTRAGRSRMVAASSSSGEDDVSLSASQEAAPTPPALSTDAALPAWVHSAEVACLRSKLVHPQVRGTVEGQPFNVSLLMF